MLFDNTPEIERTQITQIDDIRNYPQFYKCSPDFVYNTNHLGTNFILDKALHCLYNDWKYISIDTRISMLMKGMYPCIPGWHCDDFYRPSGQPDLINAPHAEHLCLIFGNCSRTRFINEKIQLELPTIEDLQNENFYGIMHKKIERLNPCSFTIYPGDLWSFTPTTWHRGEVATENGWRYFIRITGSDHIQPVNEIRTQTQVYLTDPFMGW